MTDAEYQQLYEGNKMSAKGKLEWEAYQDWQTYIQNAMAGNTEIIDLYTKDKVFTIDDNLPLHSQSKATSVDDTELSHAADCWASHGPNVNPHASFLLT